MKKIVFIISFLISSSFIFAQKSSLAIIEIQSIGLQEDNSNITNIIRFEMEKLGKYKLMEKEDMDYQIMMKKLNAENCFNKLCITYTGKTLGVDKVLTGSVSKLGDNRLVSLKLYDMQTQETEISKKIEIVFEEGQSINEILHSAIKEFYSNGDNFVTKDITTTTVEEEIEEEEYNPSITYYNGIAINEDSISEPFPKLAIITRPSTLVEFSTKAQVGVQYSFHNLFASKSSLGILFETNEENENIFGIDEPPINHGWQIRQELIMRLPMGYKKYEINKGYYTRYYMSIEGVFRRKQHKETVINQYDYYVGNITYNVPVFNSNTYMAHLKVGMQFVINDRIYIDPYAGLGIKIFRYNLESAQNNFGGFYNGGIANRETPNLTAGFDIGILLK